MKYIKRTILILAFLIWPAFCLAGGDYVAGIVTNMSEKDGINIFRFVQADESRYELMKGCKEIEVSVNYERVPWFSWLPFVKSGHPSKKETVEAIEYLEKARKNRQTVYFGYMGYGLVPTDTKCSFKSRGLQIIYDRGIRAVFSYYNQI
jgi:hypothetical protein